MGGGKFAASTGRPTAKTLSASGGFVPLTPYQGLCPWTPPGALPPDPRYRLALRARHGLKPPKLKILATSWQWEGFAEKE